MKDSDLVKRMTKEQRLELGFALSDVFHRKVREWELDNPPPSFWKEIERRKREPDIPEDEAHRKLGWRRPSHAPKRAGTASKR